MPQDQLTDDQNTNLSSDPNASQTRLAIAQATFSAEEFARLSALRLRARSHIDADPEELGLDLRRLQFARWLVQTGRLSEDAAEV